MSRTLGHLSYSFLLCAAVVAGSYAAVGDSQAPSVDFIAQSLSHQAEQSLDVTYTLSRVSSDHTSDVLDGIVSHYIRTPDITYLYQSFPKLKSGEVDEYSFEKSAAECRLLTRLKSGALYGRVSPQPLGALTRQSIHDPLDFALLPGSKDEARLLREWMMRGSVSALPEQVEGHDCWRVEVLNPTKTVLKYQFWLDPSIGFSPRRLQIIRDSGTSAYTFRDYESKSGDVWFPMTMVIDLGEANSAYQMISKVQTVSVGKQFSKNDLLVAFPSGTKVHDAKRDMDYTVP